MLPLSYMVYSTASLESLSKWLDSKNSLSTKNMSSHRISFFSVKEFMAIHPTGLPTGSAGFFLCLFHYVTENNAWSFNASHLYFPKWQKNRNWLPINPIRRWLSFPLLVSLSSFIRLWLVLAQRHVPCSLAGSAWPGAWGGVQRHAVAL